MAIDEANKVQEHLHYGPEDHATNFTDESLRWFSYFILAYLMLGIQLGIGSFAAYRGVSPDLLLLVVVFISLNARREEAMMGSFLLGAMQDLITLQPMGLFAFSYGIVSMIVCSAAEIVRRTHPLSHLGLTFGGGCIMGMLLIVHDYFRPIAPSVAFGSSGIGPRVMAVCVIYTTLLAPLVIGVLQLFHKLFAFDSDSRRRGYV